MSILREDAVRLALEKLDILAVETHTELQLVMKSAIEIERGWVFFYNSREYLELGTPSSQLAGNGPIFVSVSGDVTTLPSSAPWQNSIDEL